MRGVILEEAKARIIAFGGYIFGIPLCRKTADEFNHAADDDEMMVMMMVMMMMMMMMMISFALNPFVLPTLSATFKPMMESRCLLRCISLGPDMPPKSCLFCGQCCEQRVRMAAGNSNRSRDLLSDTGSSALEAQAL